MISDSPASTSMRAGSATNGRAAQRARSCAWSTEQATPFAVLCREMERELNAGFAAEGRVDPFRFFAIDDGERFYLGLAYDHFVAGGDSIVVMLHGMVNRYLGHDAHETPASVAARRYGPTYGRLFRRQFLSSAKALPEPAQTRRRLPAGVSSALRRAAGRLQRLRLRPHRCRGSREARSVRERLGRHLARSAAGYPAQRVGSAHRAPAAVSDAQRDRGRDHRKHPSRSWGGRRGRACAVPRVVSRLAPGPRRRCRCANSPARFTRRAAASSAASTICRRCSRMAVAGAEWRFMSTLQRQRFFAKHFPVCAGTTPLSVDPLWDGGHGRSPGLDYLRAVSTGPLAPMILALTMVGDVINVGISFRTTVFRREAVDGVAAAMLQSIRTL